MSGRRSLQELPAPILSVVVEYDYASTEEGNLNLLRGDEVVVTEHREGWMWGYHAGVYGARRVAAAWRAPA